VDPETEDPSELLRANVVDDVDPESARLLVVDAQGDLDALGVDREDALELAKEYLERSEGAEIPGFIAFVRERLDSNDVGV